MILYFNLCNPSKYKCDMHSHCQFQVFRSLISIKSEVCPGSLAFISLREHACNRRSGVVVFLFLPKLCIFFPSLLACVFQFSHWSNEKTRVGSSFYRGCVFPDEQFLQFLSIFKNGRNYGAMFVQSPIFVFIILTFCSL